MTTAIALNVLFVALFVGAWAFAVRSLYRFAGSAEAPGRIALSERGPGSSQEARRAA